MVRGVCLFLLGGGIAWSPFAVLAQGLGGWDEHDDPAMEGVEDE